MLGICNSEKIKVILTMTWQSFKCLEITQIANQIIFAKPFCPLQS